MKIPEGTLLPIPTAELILTYGKRFDDDNKVAGRALTELIKQFPQNADEAQILLKVAAINQLYSARVFAVHIVAKHIADLNIDAHLDADDAGRVQLVEKIARVHVAGGKPIRYLSFASKYCFCHGPELYAIYDRNARECLGAYQRDRRFRLARKDLWEYSSYFEAVKELREYFKLTPLTFEQIDKFLYLEGADLIEAREQAKGAAAQARAAQSPTASVAS